MVISMLICQLNTWIMEYNSYGHLLVLIMILTAEISGTPRSAEHRLYEELFGDYNSHVRPVTHENHTTDVTLYFSMQHLDDLDAQKQLLKVSGWLEVEWYDEYLTWNMSDYGGVERLVLPPTLVWLPSFALDNSAGEVYNLMFYNYFRVTVYNDGYIWWEPGGEFESVCKIEIKYYPFDYQVCELVFANWVYIEKEVNLTAGSEKINLETFGGNGEWKIVRTKVIRYVKNYACCPDEDYPEIHFQIYLERKSLYYVINVLLPVLLLSLLELLVFLLPCESGEKVSLGITIMLGFSVFSLLIEESVPNTSEATPVIVTYLTTAMAMSALSVCSTVAILALHHKGTAAPPPKWLTKLATFRFAKLCAKKCGVKSTCVEPIPKLSPHNRHFTSSKDALVIEDVTCLPNQPLPHTDDSDQLEKLTNDASLFNRLCHNVQKVVDKMNEGEAKTAITEEWKEVANAVNRLLFYTVLLVLILSAVAILGFLPLSKEWPELVPGS